jgi:hypothetical protein
MKEKPSYAIGEAGRRAIYAGIPVLPLAVLGCALSTSFEASVVRMVGETGLPYFIYGTAIVVAVLGMVLYNFLPKRLIVPLGVAAWIVALSLLYWWFWFGRGALKTAGH